MAEKHIRVLIIDDSASVREALSSIVAEEPGMEVMAAVGDPFAAAKHISQEVPDVILLDLEMPRMDGLTFLRKLMAQRPIPCVLCSSLLDAGSETMLAAMEAGACAVIQKPRMDAKRFLVEARAVIVDALREASRATPRRRAAAVEPQKKLSADVMLPPPTTGRKVIPATERIVCIGASTGGTEQLRQVLTALPADSPGIVIVQHMPEGFTGAFARRLDSLCAMEVREAQDGDAVHAGLALVAPGNRHMLLMRQGGRYYVSIKEGPPVSRHRPSVDVLFRSAAQYAGPNAMGVLMTGMGDDGAHGLLEMRNAGAATVAQNEATCVVFGMPKEAIALGAAERVAPLGQIAGEILRVRPSK